MEFPMSQAEIDQNEADGKEEYESAVKEVRVDREFISYKMLDIEVFLEGLIANEGRRMTEEEYEEIHRVRDAVEGLRHSFKDA